MKSMRLGIVVVLAIAGVIQTCCGAEGDTPRAEASGKAEKPVPVISDDFSDNKLTKRTGKAPGGEALPEWTLKGKAEVSDGCVKFTERRGTLELPCNVTVGTWKYRYRYPKGCPTRGWRYGVLFTIINQTNGSSASLNNPSDGHWWLGYWAKAEIGGRWPRVALSYYIVNMVGSQINLRLVGGTDWHEVVIARDADGYFYSWLDGKFVRWSLDCNRDIKDNTRIVITAKGASKAQPIWIDDIEVYDGVCLPPRESVTYDAKTRTIAVEGFDITLEKIARAVKKRSVFSYDPKTRTAVCKADLLLRPGAQLVIDNATLKMSSTKVEPRKIRFNSDVTIRLNKATLTTTGDEPFLFQGVGRDLREAFNGILRVKDSTVNNFGGLSMGGIDSLHLENSKFTNMAGGNPLAVAFRLPTHDLTVRGCLFEGKTGKETVVFRGGDQFGQLRPEPVGMDFVDCEFRKVAFLRQYDSPYYHSPGCPGGTANAVNCRFDKLKFNGTTLRHKYYLDVQVVTAAGKAVPGAKVTIVNEQDDKNHPAENLLVGQKYMKVGDQVSASGENYFTGQQSNWFKGWADVNDHRVTLTGRNGHTPLPSDRKGTMVLTASVQTADKATTPYTYTIRAVSSDGKLKGEVKGVKPTAEWFRKDSNKYANTIKVVVK